MTGADEVLVGEVYAGDDMGVVGAAYEAVLAGKFVEELDGGVVWGADGQEEVGWQGGGGGHGGFSSFPFSFDGVGKEDLILWDFYVRDIEYVQYVVEAQLTGSGNRTLHKDWLCTVHNSADRYSPLSNTLLHSNLPERQ